MGYRRDIDGLRAVSVLAVVLFHAGVPGFTGGFVGVDVFFVISGYLITSIVLADLARERFSIATFYERRIRRIFPALFAVVLATAIAGSSILLPHDLAELGRSVIAATLFVSNVFFHWTSDYFAGPAHLKPLLHTWSLSVEEQFYVVFPCLLWGIARWGRGRWLVWLMPLLIGSLALSIWGVSARPQATFYLAPMRAWELLIGAVLATGQVPAFQRAWQREAASLLGLGMIVAAVALYSEATPFPGTAALLPCVGAALLIHSGASAQTLTGRILGLTPMVGLGLVSYSLYLWHWPIFVFARHWAGGPLGDEATALAVAASLTVAILSWRFIERPFRRHTEALSGLPSPLRGGGRGGGNHGAIERAGVPPSPILPRKGEGRPRAPLFAGAIAVMLLAIAGGATAHLSGGWPQRFPDYQPAAIAGREAMREGACFLRPEQPASAFAGLDACTSGPAEAPRVIVWGDSFAAHLLPGLAAEGLAARITQLTASGCPPIAGLKLHRRPHCQAFNEQALALIAAARPAVVVLSARWEAYLGRAVSLSAVEATARALQSHGAEIVLVGQGPSFDFQSPYDAAFRSHQERAPVNFDPAINAALARISSVTVFQPMEQLCVARHCRLQVAGEYLYFDGGHLSPTGSRLVARALAPHIATAIERARNAPSPAIGRLSYWRAPASTGSGSGNGVTPGR